MNIDRFKISGSQRTLLLLAGLMWICAGSVLLTFATVWLSDVVSPRVFILAGTGVTGAVLIHHFGFLRVVDKNLRRILPMEGKRCVFSFMTWKSYILVAGMMGMGIALRHSPIPKPYLAVVYIGIGLALILSSVRYLRVLIKTRGATPEDN